MKYSCSRLLCQFAAIVTVGALSSNASAQLTVAPMHWEIDGWEIVPIVDGNDVDSLLIFRVDTPPDPAGNITAIWAIDTGSGWVSEAWTGVPRGEVVQWAVDALALQSPDEFDNTWTVEWAYAESLGAPIAGEPEPFGVGLPEWHPIEPGTAQLVDPTPVLQALESAGEPAAAGAAASGGSGIGIGPIDDDGLPCLPQPDTIWAAVAAAVEAELLADDTADAAFDAVMTAAGCGGCTPRLWIKDLGCTPWACTGPWSFLIPWADLGCSSNATFQIDVIRTCSRRYTEIEADCTFHRCVQTKTCTGRKIATDTVEIPNCNYAAWIAGAPTAPTWSPDCDCDTGCGCTGWTGPCP